MRHVESEVPASVAQSDTRSTGDQKIVGLIPAGCGNILSWKLIMKYVLRLSSPLIQDGQMFLAKEYAQVLVNRFED